MKTAPIALVPPTAASACAQAVLGVGAALLVYALAATQSAHSVAGVLAWNVAYAVVLWQFHSQNAAQVRSPLVMRWARRGVMAVIAECMIITVLIGLELLDENRNPLTSIDWLALLTSIVALAAWAKTHVALLRRMHLACASDVSDDTAHHANSPLACLHLQVATGAVSRAALWRARASHSAYVFAVSTALSLLGA